MDKVELIYGEVTREPGYCAVQVDVRLTEPEYSHVVIHCVDSDILGVRDQWLSNLLSESNEYTKRLYLSRQEGLLYEGQEYTSVYDVTEIAVIDFGTICDQFEDDPVAAGMPTLAIDNPCR